MIETTTAVAVVDTPTLARLIQDAVSQGLTGSASPSTADSNYLTTKDAARYLGVSADTVRRWDALGHLKRRQFGQVIRYRRADLDNLLDGVQSDAK